MRKLISIAIFLSLLLSSYGFGIQSLFTLKKTVEAFDIGKNLFQLKDKFFGEQKSKDQKLKQLFKLIDLSDQFIQIHHYSKKGDHFVIIKCYDETYLFLEFGKSGLEWRVESSADFVFDDKYHVKISYARREINRAQWKRFLQIYSYKTYNEYTCSSRHFAKQLVRKLVKVQ